MIICDKCGKLLATNAIEDISQEDACMCGSQNEEISSLRAKLQIAVKALNHIIDHGWGTVEDMKKAKSTRERIIEIEKIAREALDEIRGEK